MVKSTATLLGILLLVMIGYLFSRGQRIKDLSTYSVTKLTHPMKTDGNWNKHEWKNINSVDVNHYMGEIPKYRPHVQVKMMYGDNDLYVIYRVKERYIRCIHWKYNSAVWHDNAVEFFFSPDTASSRSYFNLEINCGGTPLMGYYNAITNKSLLLDTNDLKKITIAHSLPQKITTEIIGPVTWTIECKIPFSVIEKYAQVTLPKPNVIWRANFYKIADTGSNPHFITWSPVHSAHPNFHLPQFFGELKFQ
jgi:hypothetical protein